MYVKKFSQKIWKLLLDNKRQFYSIKGRMMTLKSPKAVNRTFQVYQLNFSLARLFFKYEFTISLSVKRILSFNKRFLTKLISGLLQLFYLCQVSIFFLRLRLQYNFWYFKCPKYWYLKSWIGAILKAF